MIRFTQLLLYVKFLLGAMAVVFCRQITKKSNLSEILKFIKMFPKIL